ncbi:MAG: dihydropteroate synthase [Planctomycetota bacterium]
MPSHPHWRLSPTRTLTLDEPQILAILNVTPDSFSDGGELHTTDAIVARAQWALADGAHMLDIGGESTRPGAQRVPPEQQIARTRPAIRAIRDAGIDAPISIDTTRAGVAEAALDAGADAINDVSGGTEDPAILTLAAERSAGIILMHRLRPPEHDSYSDRYTDTPVYDKGVVDTVRDALRDASERAISAGCAHDAIVLDPGLGFGKTVEQNIALVNAAHRFEALGHPTLSGASRKSFVGAITGVDEPRERVAGSLAFALAHHASGVRLFRVHDVAPHAHALRVAHALNGLPRTNHA